MEQQDHTRKKGISLWRQWLQKRNKRQCVSSVFGNNSRRSATRKAVRVSAPHRGPSRAAAGPPAPGCPVPHRNGSEKRLTTGRNGRPRDHHGKPPVAHLNGSVRRRDTCRLRPARVALPPALGLHHQPVRLRAPPDLKSGYAGSCKRPGWKSRFGVSGGAPRSRRRRRRPPPAVRPRPSWRRPSLQQKDPRYAMSRPD